MTSATFLSGCKDWQTTIGIFPAVLSLIVARRSPVLVWTAVDKHMQELTDACRNYANGFLPTEEVSASARSPILTSVSDNLDALNCPTCEALFIVGGPAPQFWMRFSQLFFMTVADDSETHRKSRENFRELQELGAAVRHQPLQMEKYLRAL